MFGDRKYGSPQNAITVWKDHMVSQGFGYKLGVDLPGEKRGLIPNAQFYDKAYRGHWNGLTVISISIGQGEILATPLQIANLGATIANRGYFITPHIVKEIQDNQLDSIYRTPRYTTIEKRHYESVVEGINSFSGDSLPFKYCSISNAPKGTPYVAPQPPFSTYTAMAIFGLFIGAKPINTEWSCPRFCAVPVFPQASKSGTPRLLYPCRQAICLDYLFLRSRFRVVDVGRPDV